MLREFISIALKDSGFEYIRGTTFPELVEYLMLDVFITLNLFYVAERWVFWVII